jgi:hypothetical protein
MGGLDAALRKTLCYAPAFLERPADDRTIKAATVKRYHCDRHEELERHLAEFINAYNFGRRLKTPEGPHP